jgi:hypothetical protein
MNEHENGFPKPYDAIAGFRWWEGKRWIYNLAVGLVGLSVILFNMSMYADPDWFAVLTVQVLFYGVFLNVCYCAGFFVEMVDQVYLKATFRLPEYRVWLLALGTAASMFVTVVGGLMSVALTGQPN